MLCVLQRMHDSKRCIDGEWVVARPLNYTKNYLSIWERLERAWKVFTCEADVFAWPKNQ